MKSDCCVLNFSGVNCVDGKQLMRFQSKKMPFLNVDGAIGPVCSTIPINYAACISEMMCCKLIALSFIIVVDDIG